jgi:hypothetical protein
MPPPRWKDTAALHTFPFFQTFSNEKRRPIDGRRRQSGRMETDQRGPRVNALANSLHQAAYINVGLKVFLFPPYSHRKLMATHRTDKTTFFCRLTTSLRKGGGCALRQLKYSIKLGILLAAGRCTNPSRTLGGGFLGSTKASGWPGGRRVGAHVSFIPDEDRETTGYNYR